VCPAPANVQATCTNSVCGTGGCLQGFFDCNGDMTDGCEINIAKDPNNCGKCGTVCAGGNNAQAACGGGTCTIACNKNWGNCDNDPSNGCEKALDSDPNNCGACNNACGVMAPNCVNGMCTSFYSPTGVQQNVDVSQLVGWTQCFNNRYWDQSYIPQIQNQCTKQKMMIACRQYGSNTIQLLAWADRSDVMFDTGSGAYSTHTANGVDFYFSGYYSWGFAPQGAGVYRNSCDTNGNQSDQRMCWHTSSNYLQSGYRCGNNYDGSYERLIFQAD
jgi:hypothetical protein